MEAAGFGHDFSFNQTAGWHEFGHLPLNLLFNFLIQDFQFGLGFRRQFAVLRLENLRNQFPML
jgi:hypothetical protein